MYKLLTTLALVISIGVCAEKQTGTGNIICNPGCEKTVTKKGKILPEKINTGNYSGSQGEFCLDTETFKSGSKSARLQKNNTKGWSAIIFKSCRFPALKKKTKFEVTVNLQAEKARLGIIVIQGYNGNRKNCLWKQIYSFRGTFEWRKITKLVEVPKGIVMLNISIRLNKGTGTVWADDCTIKEKKQQSQELTVSNSDFEAPCSKTTGLPTGWHRKTFEGFETSAAVNTVGKAAEGKKAVSLSWESGGTKYGLETESINTANKKALNFSAMFKSDGDVKGALMVEAFDKNGCLLDYFTSDVYSSKKWKRIDFPVSFPVGTEKVRLCCLMLGKGKVYYDDIKIKVCEFKASKKPMNFYAKCIPLDSVKVWNKGKPVFHTFVDSPCSLTFHFKGIKKELKDPALVIELPAEIKLEECFNTHEDIPGTETPETEKFMRNGKKYKRYIFKNALIFRRYIQSSYAYGRKLTMAFSPVSKNMEGKSYDAFWYLENAGMRTPRKHFKVKFLSPLAKLPNPSNFYVGYWVHQGIMFTNPELYKRVLKKYKEANMTGRGRRRSYRERDDQFADNGWKLYTSVWALDYARRMSEFRKIGYKGKSYCRVMDTGKIDDHKLCPYYFNNDSTLKKYIEKLFRKKFDIVGTRNGEFLCLDTEPWSPHTWCYCDNCRKEFAKRYKMDKVPSIAEIKSKYSKKWRDFRVDQSTATIKVYCDALRKILPDSKIYDYDYPRDFTKPDYRRAFDGCSKDSVKNEKYIDGHVSSYYHYLGANAFDLIKINRGTLKKDYFPILAIDGPGTYLNSTEVISPRMFKLTMLASAALGCKGLWIYSDSETDGMFYKEINEGMNRLALLESFYEKGKVNSKGIEAAGLPYSSRKIGKNIYHKPDWKKYLRSTVHNLNGEKLISLFNFYPEKTAFVKLKIRDLRPRTYYVSNPVNKTLLGKFPASKLKSGILCKILPTDAKAILVSGKKPQGQIVLGTSQTELSKQYELAVKNEKKNASEAFKPVEKGKISIKQAAFGSEIDGILKVETPAQNIWLGINAGGIIKGWQADKRNICGFGKRKSVILCRDRFWMPHEMRGGMPGFGQYELKKAYIKGKKAVVVLAAENKAKGICLQKTFEISSDVPGFKLKYELYNKSNEVFSMALWNHNFINLNDVDFFVPGAKGIVKFRNQHGDKLFPAPGVTNYYGFKKKYVAVPLKANWASCLFPSDQSGLVITVDLDKIMLLYTWSNRTIEWICSKTDVQPETSWAAEFEYKFYPETTNKRFFSK